MRIPGRSVCTCPRCVSKGGGTPQSNREGVSAGRTGLGEAVEWNELHGHNKKNDSGVKKLICIISFVASSNSEREEGLKRLKRLFFV